MSTNPPLVACWLDASIGEANAYLPLKQRFEGVSNRITSWHYFDCIDNFKDFVDSNPNMKFVAIMSGNFARQVVPLISDRECLQSVYILCGNPDRCNRLQADEPKVKGVFVHQDNLFTKIQQDLQ